MRKIHFRLVTVVTSKEGIRFGDVGQQYFNLICNVKIFLYMYFLHLCITYVVTINKQRKKHTEHIFFYRHIHSILI